MAKKKKPNRKMQAWIDARKRHRLSHAQVQMARELGMNPRKLGRLDNHDQEPWKMPLREYIEHLYFKRFGKERPDVVHSIEEKVRLDEAKKARRREVKLKAHLENETDAGRERGADEDPHLVVELQQQALESVRATSPQSDDRRRTAADLLERAQVLGDARRAKEAEDRARKKTKRERETAKRRQEHLESLRGKEPKLWSKVHELIDTRQPKRYDEAVAILRDLHDLAGLQEDVEPFRLKMSALHDEHQRKTTLVERFRQAKLPRVLG